MLVQVYMVPCHSLFLFLWQRSVRREAVVSNKVRGDNGVYSRYAAFEVRIYPPIIVFSFSDPSCHSRQALFNQSIKKKKKKPLT